MQTFPFKSKSSDREYTAVLADDGKLLCNCNGWTIKKGDKPRHCTHTKEIAGKAAIVTRGEFVFLVDANATIAPPPAIEPSTTKAPMPMLASAMTDPVTGVDFDWRYDGVEWVMEKKIDGWRCIVIKKAARVEAFTREGNPIPLPAAMLEVLRTFPDGTFDGELVDAVTGKSWTVTTASANLVFVAFDVLNLRGRDVTFMAYGSRRGLLMTVLAAMPTKQTSVTTVEQFVPCWRTVEDIWAAGGEGVILKRKSSTYRPGYRSPEWVKVKASKSATLELIGFKPGKSGPCSAMRLRDTDGKDTTVKVLGNALLAQVTRAPQSFVGRRVVITFQEKTPAGSYRHGQFDHFAGDGE